MSHNPAFTPSRKASLHFVQHSFPSSAEDRRPSWLGWLVTW